MPSVVIRPDREASCYVVWSTVTESPHAYGDWTQMSRLLQAGIRDNDPADVVDPLSVLERADRNGSSAMGRWRMGHWGHDPHGFIYKQAGWLARADLWQAAIWQCEGRRRDILDLLEPLEDTNAFRRHLDRRKRLARNDTPLRPGARIAEAELAEAGAAVAAIKRVIGSWNTVGKPAGPLAGGPS